MRETAQGPSAPRLSSPHPIRSGVLEITATLVVGVLLAAVGPYGTFEQASAAERLVYWVAVVLIAFAVYRPSCALAASAAGRIGFSAPAAWIVAVLTMSFPVTLLVWLASYRHTPSLWPSLDEYLGFYGSVLLIGAGLMLVVWLVRRASSSPQLAPPAAAPEPASAAAVPNEHRLAAEPSSASRLMTLLPSNVRGELLALQMEDHYVRVHTDAGNALLLMRMRDAVAEVEGIEGAQVHRSWWVARSGIEGSDRDGRRTSLKLRNGLEVPISRERVHSLPQWMVAAIAPR
jgi:hypothetical protein